MYILCTKITTGSNQDKPKSAYLTHTKTGICQQWHIIMHGLLVYLTCTMVGVKIKSTAHSLYNVLLLSGHSLGHYKVDHSFPPTARMLPALPPNFFIIENFYYNELRCNIDLKLFTVESICERSRWWLLLVVLLLCCARLLHDLYIWLALFFCPWLPLLFLVGLHTPRDQILSFVLPVPHPVIKNKN